MSLWGDDSPLGAFARRQEEADKKVAEKQRPGGRQRPLTVTQAVRQARQVLEKHFGTLWIEGETTSLVRASSGHLYFALKDGRSQIRAVMWRSDAQRLRFRIEDGQTLRCRGSMTIYERDGKFQFYVQYAEPAGLGADALALEQLKRKLAAEGLFDAARKRPLPVLPRRIGVVTSRSGAAVRDIIRAVNRRFPVPILVADCMVQGAGAPRQIVRALGLIGRTDVDVIIVGRGGGSANDLAAFNDEAVVRAVAGAPVPTISAVGHEIDSSLSDLAADHRAATPTMAGEMAVPVLADLAEALQQEESRLHREMLIKVRHARQDIDGQVAAATRCVTHIVHRQRQALGELRTRLESRHPHAKLVAHRAELRELSTRLDSLMRQRVDRAGTELRELGGRLDAPMRARLHRAGHEFASLAARLDPLSPLRVLERGYALATRDEHVITDAGDLAPGDAVNVRLGRGSFDCRVEQTHPAAEPGPGPEDDDA